MLVRPLPGRKKLEGFPKRCSEPPIHSSEELSSACVTLEHTGSMLHFLTWGVGRGKGDLIGGLL
ncbi:hypothetical protein AJ87_13565 [Rhizobium yanglingense]|nr:hypothetical protein AJ87_13565 [Rhizobium yanglingense]